MILHGFWLPDSFAMALWATPGGVATLESVSGDPAGASYRELCRQLPADLDPFRERHTLLLPGRHGRVFLSSAAIEPGATPLPCRVTTAVSVADCVLEYLYRNPLEGASGEARDWGSTLRYWRRLAEFGRHLCERRSFAPGIVCLEGRHYPAWQAACDQWTQAEFHQLVSQMPPVCRALGREGDDAAGEDQPEALVLSFVDACVDHLVRSRILRRRATLEARRKSHAPLPRQWLKTLKNGHLDYLSGPPAHVVQLANEVGAWLAYLRPSCTGRPWRLAFTARAPATEDGDWEIEYLLRSTRNPALAITAAQLWAAPRHSAVHRLAPSGREILLTDLGNALPHFPQMRESLGNPQPCGCLMNRDEFTQFLAETAPLLRRHGFGVTLPEWCEETSSNMELRLHVQPRAPGARDRVPLLSINALMSYRWEVTLGGQSLSEDEFRTLAETRRALLFYRGRWFRVDPEALRRSARWLDESRANGDLPLARLLQAGEELRSAGALAVGELRLTDLPRRSLADAAQFALLAPPASFRGVLRPYQQKGYSWLAFVGDLELGACLADDMGLGKTVQMIAYLLRRRETTPKGPPTLVVCPMSVVGNWVRELERFGPTLRVMVHHGNDRETETEFLALARRHDVVVTTYNLVLRDQKTFRRCDWDNLVLDEAQNIKNPATKQAGAIRALRAARRFCLTGTPIENRLTELWSIIDFLNPNHLGSMSAFRRDFAVPIERGRDRGRAELLQQMIRPFVLRRLKSDGEVVKDLPNKQEMKVYCNLTLEQAALYQALVEQMIEAVGQRHGSARKGLVLSTLTRLKQVTNHPVHFLRDGSAFSAERSGKLQRLEEMLEDLLAEGDKALIFTQFAEIGPPLQQKLQQRFGVEVLYMDGHTPKAARDQIVSRFQADGGPPLFLVSLKTGGFGLNLTAANHVFHFDRWWNPAVEDQATDRAFRLGQHRNVQVHKFICIGTVEEKIDQMIEAKKQLANDIVSAGEGMLSDLSTDRLRELFSLTQDAVVE